MSWLVWGGKVCRGTNCEKTLRHSSPVDTSAQHRKSERKGLGGILSPRTLRDTVVKVPRTQREVVGTRSSTQIQNSLVPVPRHTCPQRTGALGKPGLWHGHQPSLLVPGAGPVLCPHIISQEALSNIKGSPRWGL